MIFTHSWNEKRFRKQITKQIRRKQSTSQLKRLSVMIILTLFSVFILYTKLTANKSQSLSTCKPVSSNNTLQNIPVLNSKQSNDSYKEEKTTGNTQNIKQSSSFQTIASISTNKENDKKEPSTFELNSQDIETLESLYRERLNSSIQ